MTTIPVVTSGPAEAPRPKLPVHTARPADAQWLTYGQASAHIGIPLGTLYSWVHLRRIPHTRLGPRLVRFSRVELDGWLLAHRVEAKR